MGVYVFSASYNSNIYAKHCIESVKAQTVKVNEHYYIDDGSTDNTREVLSHYTKNSDDYPNLTVTFTDDRFYKLKNLYEFVQKLNSDDIVCVLDGDDWLASQDAIEKVIKEYDDPSVEYVYTNWQYSHDQTSGISKPIPNLNWDPYDDSWITSAMSTFRVSAFKAICELNFRRWDNEWFTMACDQAYVLPILWHLRERDGDYRAVKFVDEPLYVYQFLQNPSKPRYGKANTDRAGDAAKSAGFIRTRRFCNE
jgi:glycosyltransferase involved in cell wall biosynthesis